MKSKQITIQVSVRQDYAWATEGTAKIEIDVPACLVDSIDTINFANVLLIEATRQNDEQIAEVERQAAEKAAAEAAAVASNGHLVEPIPA